MIWRMFLLLLLILLSCPSVLSIGSMTDGRYSFSLTTFDPEGRLGQVDRAQQAASMIGTTPIIAAVVSDDCILLAAPQYLPSIWMEDDGTSRFCLISSEIVLCHSGLSADGRVLVLAAQKLAIQHEYIFDEEIPIDLFLEELSLICQEYTMKPAVRPFGVTLLVAHVPKKVRDPNDTDLPAAGQLYQVDPAGTISALGRRLAVINGHSLDSPLLRESLLDISTAWSQSWSHHDKISSILRLALKDQASRSRETTQRPPAIISAVLSRTLGFSVQRLAPS